ncbi:MAG: hypothetical protein E5V66_18125 [Mesorhizobium sp.]|uniref:aspartate/glutamate racemase family protein n=1 Tax=Mesorhizobium sp. TaxID=1871066 RepID=UPI001228C25C|nr:aspartate/glutamate racemase family protein [Mesorhizobium sp.]TIW10433.1 MAG: hypothetical protein E5V66_18125 [Mesorhizobium sp.]
MTSAPRIALIHALEESVEPARAAFQQLWPQAYCFDLLDTSLAIDRAEAGKLDDLMVQRFLTLADYAAGSSGRGGATAGILFTCSAFGPAIDTVKAAVSIPVLRPNEAAFDLALDQGSTFLLVVTFAPSAASLEAELQSMAAARGKSISLRTVVVDGALDSLKAGDGATHDALAAEAIVGAGDCDVVILGQFSLARARGAIERCIKTPVVTTPHSAAEAMRKLITAGRPHWKSTGAIRKV